MKRIYFVSRSLDGLHGKTHSNVMSVSAVTNCLTKAADREVFQTRVRAMVRQEPDVVFT